MSMDEILAVLAGLLIGAAAGYALLRAVALGAIVGGVTSLILIFGVGRWASDVIAVETPDAFERSVMQSELPVLVDFYSDRCPPCKELVPTIEQLAHDYEGRVRVVKVDVIEAPEIAHRYGVRSIPHVVLFLNGQPARRWVGVKPGSEYRTVMDAVLSAEAVAPE